MINIDLEKVAKIKTILLDIAKDIRKGVVIEGNAVCNDKRQDVDLKVTVKF